MTGHDRAPFVPDRFVYEQVADRLAERIRSGEFGGTGKLPGERELAGQYGTGVKAVRHARQELMRRGLVVTVPGKGTFTT